MEMYCLSVIIQMLNPNNTLSFNRLLAHGIGLVESIVYAILIAKQSYYNANGMLHEGGWFYSTIPDLQESTTLGEKAQRTAIKHLVGYGLIECERKGNPARRFFRIVNNPAALNEILENGQKICDSFKKQDNGAAMQQMNFAMPFAALMNENSTQDFSTKNVESVSGEDKKMPENGVDFSYRPSAATSSALAQDKSKDNKNQRKIYDDRSINQSAREKIFEGEKSENGVESVETVQKAETFAEILQEIGIDWYDITPIEPENEEFFEEYSERERRTRRCVLPYHMMQDKKAVVGALKYLSAFSYNCGCGESENKDESAYYKTVINRLTDFMTREKTVLPNLAVTYAKVFDAVNHVISEYTLSEFIYDFWEHWEEVTKTRNISHARPYMMTCLWNFLNEYDEEHEAAEKRREREILNSG